MAAYHIFPRVWVARVARGLAHSFLCLVVSLTRVGPLWHSTRTLHSVVSNAVRTYRPEIGREKGTAVNALTDVAPRECVKLVVCAKQIWIHVATMLTWFDRVAVTGGHEWMGCGPLNMLLTFLALSNECVLVEWRLKRVNETVKKRRQNNILVFLVK